MPVVVLLLGLDLAVIALYLAYLATLHGVSGFSSKVSDNFSSIFGAVNPVASAILHVLGWIHDWAESEIAKVSKTVDQLWTGVLESLIYIVDGVRTLGASTVSAFETLYGHALPSWARWATSEALGYVGPVAAPYATIAEWLLAETGVAASATAAAITTATARAADFTIGQVTDVYQAILTETAATLTSAEAYADFQIDTVRQDVHAVAHAIESAAGAAADELPQLPALAWEDLQRIYNGLDLSRLNGQLAAVPILGALVYALARDTGLDSAACRSKVKGICGTDAAGWAKLLAGAALLEGGLSLEALLAPAREAVHVGGAIIREAA